MAKARIFLLILLTCLGAGCGTKVADEASLSRSKKPQRSEELQVIAPAQRSLEEPADEEWGELPFKIAAVYENQCITKVVPYHVEGGDWTFFDCQVQDSEPVQFTVGVQNGQRSQNFSWGKAFIVVSDHKAGEQFVASLARAFHDDVPPMPTIRTPIEPLEISTAILGEDLQRGASDDSTVSGGYSGVGGGWTATKWFPAHEGKEAEVFFNYSLSKKMGEFSEKDPDYRKDLLAVFASSLRDGRRPERTPEMDVNLTLKGPRIEEVCCLLANHRGQFVFSPEGQRVIYIDGKAICALQPSLPDHARKLQEFENRPDQVFPLDENLNNFLVRETIPETPGVWSSADPVRLWWLEGDQRSLLVGPEKGLGLGEDPVSPDHQFIVLERWKENPTTQGRYKTIVFLNRESGATLVADVPNQSLTQTGWTIVAGRYRAVLVSNYWDLDHEAPKRVYLTDPDTGDVVPAPDVPVPKHSRPISPEGAQQIQLEGKMRFVVINRVTLERRYFEFHEDDMPYVNEENLQWLSERYIVFRSARLAFIDTITMKMNYPKPRPKHGESSYLFSRDFRWALYEKQTDDKTGLYLGRIVPSE